MSFSCTSILRAPVLLAHIDNIYYNKDAPRELIAASHEAWGTGLLISAGGLFGLAGRAIVMAATRARFSIPLISLYGVLGMTVGILVSTPLMYSYLSNFSKREDILIEYQEQKKSLAGKQVRDTFVEKPFTD